MKKILLIITLFLGALNLQAQDIIILKTGDEIENVKILDTLESVIYRKDGMAQTIAKADIFMIKYSNGTKVKISSKQQVAQPVKVTPPAAKVEEPKEPENNFEDRETNNDTKNVVPTEPNKHSRNDGSGDVFVPRKFGFGANVNLLSGESLGANILMPLSFSSHFRMEFEFGLSAGNFKLSAFNGSSSSIGDGSSSYSVGLLRLGVGLFGMAQRGRVNIYGGFYFSNLKALGVNNDATLNYLQFAPTFGAEYGLSNHFTLGCDFGLPLTVELYRTKYTYYNPNTQITEITYETEAAAKLLTRSRFIMRFYF